MASEQQNGVTQILHVFADTGAEDPCLSRYGDVYRFSINITPNRYSEAVQCDARHLPLRPDATFDLGVFHPPCGGVSPMSDTGSGSREDWPDLIPVAREIAEQHCEHWIIENKPRESLNAEVVLDGHMFKLGIEYKRAFETSFPVPQPWQQDRIADTSTFFYSEWSKGEWASVKGSSMEFSKEHLAKNTIPAVYLDYLMKHYHRAVDGEERPDYSEYDSEMDQQRAEAANESLEAYR